MSKKVSARYFLLHKHRFLLDTRLFVIEFTQTCVVIFIYASDWYDGNDLAPFLRKSPQIHDDTSRNVHSKHDERADVNDMA